jgi:hypothetical protein
VFICLLGDDILKALFGRSRMIGGHSPNCSIGELQDRFGSAMILDYIYEQHPELERRPCRLNMSRMRHVDHLRPAHFKHELRADSCDLESCWASAVKAAELIITQYGVRMDISFAERFQRKDTDLMCPLGGKYPAISGEVDRSMADLSSEGNDLSTIDPDTVAFAHLVAGVNFDQMIASEQEIFESATAHSLFAEINNSGDLAHKKTILRTFFDMTLDSHSSHDRVQHVRGFTTGGKSWNKEISTDENISPSTHFQLGHLFTMLVSHNGTHLGLAVAKCTLIKRGPPGSKAASVTAIPRAELLLANSPYTVSGQVFLLVPLPEHVAWA